MSYLVAAYVVTAIALAGYWIGLHRERNSLSNRRKSNSG